jgi:hypothetical protein
MLKPRIKFVPEKRGKKTNRPYHKGSTFNYKGDIFKIVSHVKEYVNKEGNIVVYCKVNYYDRFEMKDKSCYAIEIWF